ncbi:hypothetical protein [Halorubrum sp. DTA46]|uniref:DUF7857 domain-containing protein n=1 Tax=Halorubrum sp. DTA46 TaxID=3402162 RepID=UPI003AAC108A
MDLTWSVDRDAGVSMVRCRVRNDGAVRRRVRIRSRFDGPVLPPRRAGVPEAGWDETGVTLRLDPGERRALGFAAVAPSIEPPVELTETEPIAGHDGELSVARERGGTTVADALRTLGDHRPPRSAVESGADGGDRIAVDANGGGSDGRANDAASGSDADSGSEGDAVRGTEGGDEPQTNLDTDGALSAETRTATPPPAAAEPIDAWLDAVEKRIERAERLTDADLETATAMVESAGGLDELRSLDDRIATDAERLRAVSERASSLAARAEASDAPIDAMERVA